MSEFINTIEKLGDDAVVDSIINRTITEFKDNLVMGIGYYDGAANTAIGYAFTMCADLRVVDVPNASSIGPHSFRGCANLVSINAPLVQLAGDSAFNDCSSLIEIKLPNLSRTTQESASGTGFLAGCTSLRKVDLPKVTEVGGRSFNGDASLTALILRSETLCTLGGVTSFNGTPIASGTGYIYVPKALLSDEDETKDYRRATNWSTHGTQFRALEDYTVDGTITGELDETKI